MGRLHRLFNHHHQLLAQLAQVYLMAQRGAESGNYPSSIILAPVKAAVDDSLNTPSQGLEQGSNGQCGGHDDQGLLMVPVTRCTSDWRLIIRPK